MNSPHEPAAGRASARDLPRRRAAVERWTDDPLGSVSRGHPGGWFLPATQICLVSALLFSSTFYVLRFHDDKARVLFRLPFQPAVIAVPTLLVMVIVLLKTARRPTQWIPRLWTLLTLGLSVFAVVWAFRETGLYNSLNEAHWSLDAIWSECRVDNYGTPLLHAYVVATAGAVLGMVLRLKKFWPDKRWVQLAFPFTLLVGVAALAPFSYTVRNRAVELQKQEIRSRLALLEQLDDRLDHSKILDPHWEDWGDWKVDKSMSQIEAKAKESIAALGKIGVSQVLVGPGMWPGAAVLEHPGKGTHAVALADAGREVVEKLALWPEARCPGKNESHPESELKTPRRWESEDVSEKWRDEMFPERQRLQYEAFAGYARAHLAQKKRLCRDLAPEVGEFEAPAAQKLIGNYHAVCDKILGQAEPSCEKPWIAKDAIHLAIPLRDVVPGASPTEGDVVFDAKAFWLVARMKYADARGIGCREFTWTGELAGRAGLYCHIFPSRSDQPNRPSSVQVWFAYSTDPKSTSLQDSTPQITYLALSGCNGSIDGCKDDAIAPLKNGSVQCYRDGSKGSCLRRDGVSMTLTPCDREGNAPCGDKRMLNLQIDW